MLWLFRRGSEIAASAKFEGATTFIFTCIKEVWVYLFKKGRKHYLDFLRNITPQALLVFIGTVFLHGGLHGQPTPQKIAVGVVLWGMAAFAAWCSISLFFEPLKEEHVDPGKERARAAYPDIGGSRAVRLKQSAKRWWRLTPLMAELVVVMVIIEGTCVVAAISGGYSAVSALHLN
jgi:hypothetical protein